MATTVSYESGFRTTLKKKLNPTDTTIELATAPTVTVGRMFLKSGTQKEWISYTGVSGTTLTGVTRGLSQTSDPASSGTGLTWLAGQEIILVAMHDQLFDRQRPIPIQFADTTARDNALGGDGVAVYPYINVYTIAEGLHRNYNLSSGQWESIDTGTVTPNASETEAGKVEIATDSEVTAGTETGGSGAKLVTTPKQQKISISLKNSTTSLDDTDYISSFNGLEDKKILVSDVRNELKADETKKGTVERLTDSEASTGTDTERYASIKQISDNYGITPKAGTTYTLAEANTERSKTDDTTFTKVKEISVKRGGTYTVSIDAYQTGGSNSDLEKYWVGLYVNGVAVLGTFTGNISESYTTYTGNITINDGDLVQIYYRTQNSAGPETVYVKNFNIKFTPDFNFIDSTVNTD